MPFRRRISPAAFGTFLKHVQLHGTRSALVALDRRPRTRASPVPIAWAIRASYPTARSPPKGALPGIDIARFGTRKR
jgi:hypothetical protein